MCLLTVFKPGIMPNVDNLYNGAERNSDGHGFALIVDGRIEWGHGMNADAVISAFDEARTAHPEGWALFHSRYTTHGVTNVTNCHPFAVTGTAGATVIAHNGILPSAAQPYTGDPRSDTRILAEDLIPASVFGGLHKRRARRRLAQWLLSENYPNKVAILTVDPRYRSNGYIINEHLGEYEDGVWYSNSGYCPRPKRYPSTYSYPYAPLFRDSGSKRWWEDAEDSSLWTEGTGTGTGTGWPSPTTPKGDCNYCGSFACVNLVMGICTICLTCHDCFQGPEDCDCYMPEDSRNRLGAVGREVIDAVIAKLPTMDGS